MLPIQIENTILLCRLPNTHVNILWIVMLLPFESCHKKINEKKVRILSRIARPTNLRIVLGKQKKTDSTGTERGREKER